MRKLMILFTILLLSLIGLLGVAQTRNNIEKFYSIPQGKSYVYSSDRKMSFEVYSTKKDSLIKEIEKNQYIIQCNVFETLLQNVEVDILKQKDLYLYIFSFNLLNLPIEEFKENNIKFVILNSKYRLTLDMGIISILNSKSYTLLSIDDYYGSYAYINGMLELVGINITFSEKFQKLEFASVGNIAYGDLALIQENKKYSNEIDIKTRIPEYEIEKSYKNISKSLSSSICFIPMIYDSLITITQGFLLLKLDGNLYYVDTFDFIVNELNYYDYSNKLNEGVLSYDLY